MFSAGRTYEMAEPPEKALRSPRNIWNAKVREGSRPARWDEFKRQDGSLPMSGKGGRGSVLL